MMSLAVVQKCLNRLALILVAKTGANPIRQFRADRVLSIVKTA